MKKLICLLLSVLMTITYTGAFAEDIASTEVETAVEDNVVVTDDEVLPIEAVFALGIGAIVDYNPEKEVTVGDMATAIAALDPSGCVNERYFNNQTYSSKVKFITAEAVLIDILGYSIFFGDGKIDKEDSKLIEITASKYKVTEGIEKTANEFITIKDLAELVYNTMNAKSVESVYTNNGTNSRISSIPYMELVLGMETVYGVVEKTAYSSVVSESGTNNDSIVISGTEYKCEQGIYEDYIGMNVAALLKNDGIKTSVLAVCSYDNDVVTLMADELNKAETNKNAISYWNKNNRSKRAKLSDSVDVLYNYSLYQDYTERDFKITQGRLVLIDNDNNGTYDVVKIEEYTSFEILSVSVERETIGDSYGNLVDISALIENHWPVIENEKLILPQNIPAKSIATCYTNKAGQVVRIYVDNTKAAGAVQWFEKEENIILLEEKEYIYVNEIKSKLEEIPYGTLLTVKLNHYGEIAYFEISGDSVSYGYLIAFDAKPNSLDPIRVKMYTQTSEISVFNVADTIKFNGTRMSASDVFEYNLESGLWDEAGAVTQIVTYKRNSNGEIIALNTSMDENDGNRERLHKYKDGVFTYFSNPKTICSDVRLNDTTKVFIIPTDLTSPVRYYKYGSYNILGNDSDYTCQIYNVDENHYADCIVVRQDPYGYNSINELGGAVFMVHSVGKALGDEGQVTTVLEVRQLGQSTDSFGKFIFVNSDVATTFQGGGYKVKDLKPGDVIMAETAIGATGYATFKLLYRSSGTEPYEDVKCVWYTPVNKDTFYGDSNTYAAGKIKKVIKDGCIANFKPESPEYEEWDRVITFGGNTPVYICEVANNKQYRGTVGDLQPGDTVFALMNAGNMKEFIIYR